MSVILVTWEGRRIYISRGGGLHEQGKGSVLERGGSASDGRERERGLHQGVCLIPNHPHATDIWWSLCSTHPTEMHSCLVSLSIVKSPRAFKNCNGVMVTQQLLWVYSPMWPVQCRCHLNNLNNPMQDQDKLASDHVCLHQGWYNARPQGKVVGSYLPWGKSMQFCLFWGLQKFLTGFYNGGQWENIFLSINK